MYIVIPSFYSNDNDASKSLDHFSTIKEVIATLQQAACPGTKPNSI